MKPPAYTGTPAQILKQLAAERNASLAALSRMIRRGDRYLDSFVRDGSPPELTEADRTQLAAFFRIDPWLLEQH